MLQPEFNIDSDLISNLNVIFSCHPCENLHLETTREFFICLRDRSERIGSRAEGSELVSAVTGDNFINYYRRCLEFFVSDNLPAPLCNLSLPIFSNFLKLHTLVWDICKRKLEWSHCACGKLAAAGVYQFLWQLVGRRELVSSVCVQETRARQIVYVSFGILIILLNRGLVSVYEYRICNAVHILQPFVVELKVRGTRCQADDLKTAAILLLIPLVDVKENEEIISVENYVVYILSGVRHAMNSPDLTSSLHRHDLIDLNHGLCRLARFDANKKSLLLNGVLDTISKILQIPTPANFDENNLTLNSIALLWQLCFLSESRDRLSNDKNLLGLCRDIQASSPSEKCREAAEGVFWTLAQSRTNAEMANDINSSTLTSTSNARGHIVFACTPGNQKMVNLLKRKLRTSGYHIYEETGIKCMEEAIRNASALVPCLCHAFSSSPYCRQQILSALSNRVPLVPVLMDRDYVSEPWLQFLLATVIYVPFFDAQSISMSKDTLCQALRKFGIGRFDEPVSAPPRSTLRSPFSVIASFPRSNSVSREAKDQFSSNFDLRGRRCSTLVCVNDSSGSDTPTISEGLTSIACSSCNRRFQRYGYHGPPSSYGNVFSFNHCDEYVCSPRLENHEFTLAYQAPSQAIRDWTVSRIQLWLKENSLSNYADVLDWLNGPLLWELAWHRIRGSEVFFSNLGSQLSMPQPDQMLFSNALALLHDAS